MKLNVGLTRRIRDKIYEIALVVTLFEFRDWDDNQSEAYSDTLIGFTFHCERCKVP